MKVNLPASVRIALYVLTLLGAPVVVYLRAKDIIGDLELVLWGAEVSAVSALAAFNVPIVPLATAKRLTGRKGEDGAVDPGSAAIGALVAAVVVYLIMR